MCLTVHAMKGVVHHVFIHLHIIWDFVGFVSPGVPVWICRVFTIFSLSVFGSLWSSLSLFCGPFLGYQNPYILCILYNTHIQVTKKYGIILLNFFLFHFHEWWLSNIPTEGFLDLYWNFIVVVLTYFFLLCCRSGIGHIFTSTAKN